ncbi:glycerate kinase [Cardiobacteriaceae bacterium TAE3-ERU3]|nr:glycerate kinase [Cardiobacteriaceae bacterium TAE3-ERU3]
MKIIIAPDSFKESMTAADAAAAICRGVQKVLPQADCVCLPMADGGEGTAAAMLSACGGEWRTVCVHDPLMRPIEARYAVLDGGRAVIEMAEAAGLHLLTEQERDPRVASTYGVGELLLNALEQGVTEIIMAIGGSATNDAGVGMLRALGYAFYDSQGRELAEGGAALVDLDTIDASAVDQRIKNCHITIACDVNNPLCGKYGASHVFAAQKGADKEIVEQLDGALRHFAEVSAGFLQRDMREETGAGAAGGLGFALAAFLQAEMRTGVNLVATAIGLDEALKEADLVITGEGRMDGQTASGKVPHGVLRIAQKNDVPVIALAGCLGEDITALDDAGFTAVLPIIPASVALSELLEQGGHNLERTAQQVAGILKLIID